MRSVVNLLSVFAIALATMFAHAGNAMTMEGVAGTVMMADMNMGADGTPGCPPEMCAKMKDCSAAPASAFSLVPVTDAVSFAPAVGIVRVVPPASVRAESLSGDGLRRPPRLI